MCVCICVCVSVCVYVYRNCRKLYPHTHTHTHTHTGTLEQRLAQLPEPVSAAKSATKTKVFLCILIHRNIAYIYDIFDIHKSNKKKSAILQFLQKRHVREFVCLRVCVCGMYLLRVQAAVHIYIYIYIYLFILGHICIHTCMYMQSVMAAVQTEEWAGSERAAHTHEVLKH